MGTSGSTLIPEKSSPSGLSVIAAAAAGDCEKLVRLLERGGRLDLPDVNGRTSLMEAAAAGQSETVCMLLSMGASEGQKDHEGRTPLMLSVINGHINIAILLLDSGASINSQDNRGWSALHFAAARDGECDMVSLLLERRADPTLVNEDGHTALHFAAKAENLNMMNLLLKTGISPDLHECIFSRMETPLAFSVRHGKFLSAKLLFVSGANPGFSRQGNSAPIRIVNMIADSFRFKNLFSRNRNEVAVELSNQGWEESPIWNMPVRLSQRGIENRFGFVLPTVASQKQRRELSYIVSSDEGLNPEEMDALSADLQAVKMVDDEIQIVCMKEQMLASRTQVEAKLEKLASQSDQLELKRVDKILSAINSRLVDLALSGHIKTSDDLSLIGTTLPSPHSISAAETPRMEGTSENDERDQVADEGDSSSFRVSLHPDHFHVDDSSYHSAEVEEHERKLREYLVSPSLALFPKNNWNGSKTTANGVSASAIPEETDQSVSLATSPSVVGFVSSSSSPQQQQQITPASETDQKNEQESEEERNKYILTFNNQNGQSYSPLPPTSSSSPSRLSTRSAALLRRYSPAPTNTNSSSNSPNGKVATSIIDRPGSLPLMPRRSLNSPTKSTNSALSSPNRLSSPALGKSPRRNDPVGAALSSRMESAIVQIEKRLKALEELQVKNRRQMVEAYKQETAVAH